MSDSEVLVPVDSDHPAHANMFKTLDLMKIETPAGPIYFVIEGCAQFASLDEIRGQHRYFYEEHTCPTNFIPVPAVFFAGNDDPHGVFDYVDTAWMTQEYLEAAKQQSGKEYLRRVFLQLGKDPRATPSLPGDTE